MLGYNYYTRDTAFVNSARTTGSGFYELTIPTLLHFWPFNEASGFTALDKKGGNNGTYVSVDVGGTAFKDTTPAPIYDYVNDYTSFNPVALNINKIAISVWFNRTVSGNSGILRATAANKIDMYVGNDSKFYVTSQALPAALISPTAVTNNQWNHAVYNINTATNISQLFINNVLAEQDTAPGSTGTLTDLVVGSLSAVGFFRWGGSIRNLAIFSEPLTLEQRTGIYAQ